MLQPIQWTDGKIILLDQTKLPRAEEYLEITRLEGLIAAIKSLAVRGAPLLGIAGAYGLALAAYQSKSSDQLFDKLYEARERLAATRPTATNLFSMMDRVVECAEEFGEGVDVGVLKAAIITEALEIHDEDRELCESIGRVGNELVPADANILTHCNAGALATGGIGTALGVIYTAHKAGKKIKVFADETRPLLQGARLTVYELMAEGVEVTLITDGMAGYLMKAGEIDLIIVGADRIASNGDTANKIGTYTLAVLAKENNVPFYIAAPSTTFDMDIESGAEIPIEERDGAEIKIINGELITRGDVKTASPAFDVTPAALITGLITENGVIAPAKLTKLH